MGRRPRTLSRDVFTPMSEKLTYENLFPGSSPPPPTTGPLEPPAGYSPESCGPREGRPPDADEDGQLGAPEDYMWAVTPSG